jgi:hypothetical protein
LLGSRAVTLEPSNPAFRSALIGLHKTEVGDDNLKALQVMADNGTADANELAALHFTLAKASEDFGDYARAFAEWLKGNAERRRQSDYDIDRDLDRFRAIAETFSADFLAARTGNGTTSDLPVFIVGMPRSGTTLVEQIIASHPMAFGAGELGIMPDLMEAGQAGYEFPTDARELDSNAWQKLGSAYTERLRALAPHAVRITDKLPMNFQMVGLIKLALPMARIVHVMRDPLDTCLSCFATPFEDGDLDFTCDLSELGRFYRGYGDLMDHWRAVLPSGAMLEVKYEDIVEDCEGEARKLIDYCGLEWNDRCPKFYETVRQVATASALQVRQPVYRTSIGRAMRYAQWLKPLRDALGTVD